MLLSICMFILMDQFHYLPQPNLRSALFTGDGFVLERFCVNMRGLCPECSLSLSETEEEAPKLV